MTTFYTTWCRNRSTPPNVHCALVFQAHDSEELSSFCEGYFLQQMPSLLEKESFKTLLLGPPCSRHGNITTSTLAHSRGDWAMEELEATLARRLRSLHITSRVWGAAADACCEEMTWAEGHCLRRFPQSDQLFTSAYCQYLIMTLGHVSANAGQFRVSYLVPKLKCQNWTVLFPFIPGSELFSAKASDENSIVEQCCPLADKATRTSPERRAERTSWRRQRGAGWTFGFVQTDNSEWEVVVSPLASFKTLYFCVTMF